MGTPGVYPASSHAGITNYINDRNAFDFISAHQRRPEPFKERHVFFDFHWITGIMVGFEIIDDPDCTLVVVDLGILRMMITKMR
ncbi:hypothetical protein, partial [Mesorhizobium sp. M1399]